jgi:hypothetical protein
MKRELGEKSQAIEDKNQEILKLKILQEELNSKLKMTAQNSTTASKY